MSKYLVIGDSILDHYLYGTVSRMSPEDPLVPVLDIDSEEYRLGGCLNVAANLRSLSSQQVFVTSIISNRCKKLLDSREIGHALSYHLPEVEGIKKTRIINLKDGKQIVRLDNIQRFGEEFLEEYRFLLKCIDFNDFDCILVSDYNKGVVDDFLIRKLSSYGKPVFVDTKNPNVRQWDQVSHRILKMNDKEWAKIILPPRYNVIVTTGEDGAMLCKPKMSGFDTTTYPLAEKVTDGDVTGAGDVFLAGLATEYMRAKNLDRAITFANAAAAKSVKLKGTVEVYL
jgi:D-beta-D-heptose 7-phosphate kinase/D-beta-D-heptose 1-phosphate adenosyltransferase